MGFSWQCSYLWTTFYVQQAILSWQPTISELLSTCRDLFPDRYQLCLSSFLRVEIYSQLASSYSWAEPPSLRTTEKNLMEPYLCPKLQHNVQDQNQWPRAWRREPFPGEQDENHLGIGKTKEFRYWWDRCENGSFLLYTTEKIFSFFAPQPRHLCNFCFSLFSQVIFHIFPTFNVIIVFFFSVVPTRGVASSFSFLLLCFYNLPFFLEFSIKKGGQNHQCKRGLTVVSFDRFPFKLLTLRISRKSVQSSSCERPKTNYSANPVSVIWGQLQYCIPISA